MKPEFTKPVILKLSVIAALFITVETLLILFIDRPLATAIRHMDGLAPMLIASLKSITDFGKSYWYLYPSAAGILLCFAWTRFLPPPPAARLKLKSLASETGSKLSLFFAVIAISGLITDGLKWVIGRARPVLDLRSQIYGFHPFSSESTWNSLPSGHATTSIALAITLCILWPRGHVFWLILGGILAASRVMVCAHYLSDILAGGMVATLTANHLLHSGQNHGILPCINRLFPIEKTSAQTSGIRQEQDTAIAKSAPPCKEEQTR